MGASSLGSRVPTAHTYECLVQRLIELEEDLYKKFPALSAERGLTAALNKGMNYIKRVQEGRAKYMPNGKAHLRKYAYLAAARHAKRNRVEGKPLAAFTRNDSADNSETKFDLQVINQAVQELPEQQRKVVELCIFAGLSLSRAAEMLSISHQAVAKYRVAAINNLRKRLAGHKKVKVALQPAPY